MPTTDSQPESLEQFLHTFIKKRSKPFGLSDAVKAVKAGFHSPPTEVGFAVTHILDDSPWLFLSEDESEYIPREAVFNGAQFLIVPQPDEIESGILVPGHRFIPFLPRETHPRICRLVFEHGDSKLTPPLKTAAMPINEAVIYLAFFGQQGGADYLQVDDESNTEVLTAQSSGDSVVTLSVFEMSDVYEACDMQAGDAFLCTVTDWLHSEYTLEHRPAVTSQHTAAATKWWCKTLEASLTSLDVEMRSADDCYEQFAQALFLSRQALLKDPPIHLGGFITASRAFEIGDIQGLARLTPPGEDAEQLFMQRTIEKSLRSSSGRIDTLAAILADVGLSLEIHEIRAYIQDAISEGTCSSDDIYSRCLAGYPNSPFHDARQKKSFKQMIAALCTEEEGLFSPFREKLIAPIRRRILGLQDNCLQWLRFCDAQQISPHDLPADESLELGAVTATLSQLLFLLQDLDHTADEISDLADLIDQIEAHLDHLLADLHDAAEPGIPKLRLLQAPTNVYQLKISLKGSKPPIWRRVMVLDNTCLDELHHVIQLSMGWTNSHLHMFEHEGILYEQASEEDNFGFSEAEPEAETEIRDLLCSEKDKLNYTYDFGDNWEHTILLEKILPIHANATYPHCIKGRRACPPEDCGGIGGYNDLLDILNNPSHAQHDELTDWVGAPIDPAAFNPCNATLALRVLAPS